MKYYLLPIFALSFLFSAALVGEERIASTLENVDLMIEDVHNNKGHNFGEQYSALNRNDYPVKLSIKIVGARNASDQLVPYTIIVKALDKVKLGKITQANPKEESSWNYEWEVEPDYR